MVPFLIIKKRNNWHVFMKCYLNACCKGRKAHFPVRDFTYFSKNILKKVFSDYINIVFQIKNPISINLCVHDDMYTLCTRVTVYLVTHTGVSKWRDSRTRTSVAVIRTRGARIVHLLPAE